MRPIINSRILKLISFLKKITIKDEKINPNIAKYVFISNLFNKNVISLAINSIPTKMPIPNGAKILTLCQNIEKSKILPIVAKIG